jgi:hypothetical protein
MGRDLCQDRAQRSNLQWVVGRNRYVVLNRGVDRQPNVTAGLPRDLIAGSPQMFCKLRSG